ncbi:hypothetical protein [Limosilactobacillus fermentum]
MPVQSVAMLIIPAKDPQAYVAGTSRSLAKAARMKDAGYSTVIKPKRASPNGGKI